MWERFLNGILMRPRRTQSAGVKLLEELQSEGAEDFLKLLRMCA